MTRFTTAFGSMEEIESIAFRVFRDFRGCKKEWEERPCAVVHSIRATNVLFDFGLVEL